MNTKSFYLALSFAAAATPSLAADPVVIGLAGPITGPRAAEGHDMKAGAFAAAQAINEAGGVLGRKVEFYIADDACEPKQAISAAGLIAARSIDFIVGHYCSTTTLAAAPTYDEEGLLQVTLSQSPKITQNGHKRLFRITPDANDLGREYAQKITSLIQQNGTRIGLIGNNSDYARSVMDAIRSQIPSDKAQHIVYAGFYEPDSNDYAAIISRMKAERVNLVLIAGSEKEMGLIVRQAPEQGFYPEFVLSSTAASAGFAGIAGCAAQGVKVVAAWNPLYFSPVDEKLRERLRSEGANGLDTAVNAYAAVEAIAEGIRHAGVADPEEAARAMKEKSLSTALGTIQFTATGNLAQPKVITYEYQGVGSPCRTVQMAPASP